MLVYNNAYDFNHCLFRVLSLLEFNVDTTLEFDKVQLFDFYLLFPYKLSEMRFPREFFEYKKNFDNLDTKYNRVINSKLTFYKLGNLHKLVYKALLSSRLVEKENFENKALKRSEKKLSKEVIQSIHNFQIENEFLLQLLIVGLNELQLDGVNGLRSRTNLFDTRYYVKG